MAEEVRARVEMIDGAPHLIDPDAAAVARVVAKFNCRHAFDANEDRIGHFRQRMLDLGRTPDDVVVMICNMDDPVGEAVGDALMPGFDWAAIRARGEVPFARGLAGRGGVQGMLDAVDPEAAKKLREHAALAVVVVDCGVGEVFSA